MRPTEKIVEAEKVPRKISYRIGYSRVSLYVKNPFKWIQIEICPFGDFLQIDLAIYETCMTSFKLIKLVVKFHTR